MKITLIYPRFEKFLSNNPDLDRGMVDYFLGDFTTPPSLGIPILVSLTPPGTDIEFIDDNSGDPIDYSSPTDLVGINCFTPQATRAFEIADAYRLQGRRVVMGGFFPSFMVDECLKHCDAVCIGEAEPVWTQIIEDARQGRLKPRYHGGFTFDVSQLAIPRRDIFYSKQSYDWDEDLIQITRGCLYNCAMCAIPAHMGGRLRMRPVDQVVAEMKTLRYENVYIADDTLFFPHKKVNEYARQLFKALAPLGKKFFVSSSLALNTAPDFLDLAAKAGVRNFYCTLNVDPVSIRALQGGAAERQTLIDLVRMLEDRGIRFFGSCALGREWDDAGIADRILGLFDEAGIHTAEFFIFTPYPGTVHWDRLKRQGRIFDATWSHYNGAHVVSRPMNLSPDELYAQFVKVWKEFFRRQKSAHTAHLEPATFSNGVRTVGKPLQKKGVRGQAAITGIGILSPIGSDEPAILSSLREGRHGLAPITKIDMRHFRMKCGGEVADFDASHWLTPEELAEYADPYLHFAIAAARKALDDAGIARAGAKNLDGIALVLATCNGGLRTAEAEYAWKHGLCDTPFSAKANLMAQNYGFGKALAAALGIRGEAWVVNTACSSSTAALGIAQTLISRGWYDTVLVGTSEVLCVSNIAGFEALRATSAQPAAPFSLPVGLNVGEGACFWVVEEMEKALLRNASCKGKIAGHATTCDAYHPTSPDPRGDGVYRTLRDAIENAGLTLDDIGCINAHGTGTEANDRAETRGIARLIGERKIPAVSTKSFFGHCMGAAGMLEATCNLLAMNAGFVPPTVNFSGPRPGCTLDYVPNSARDKQYSAFVSANYAFGGNNAAVVITTRDHEPARKSFERERVVITGTGAITSLGLGAAALVDGLRRGDVGLSSIDTLRLDGMKSRLAGFVPDFKAADVDRRLDFSPLNPISRFAVAAGRLALESAGLRTGPKNAERIGIAMGICNGSSEMEHMDSVFSSGNYAAHINGFSNIVANSTAGWVASALCLKGANITLAPGPHAGLQSLAYAFDALTERRAHAIIAAAADEVYAQTYFNYNLVDYLWPAGDEERYRLRFDDPHRKVIGEGAGVLVMEPLTHANERGSPVLAEVLGYAMTMDGGGFSAPNLNAAALARAIDIALRRSKVTPGEIDLVVWAPQGNAQDRKMLDALRECGGDAWARTPLVATTFNTGYIESASILVSIAAVLESLKSDTALWPQKTGDEGIDNRALCGPPRNLLAIGSSDVGYNYAVVLGMAESGEKDEPQNIE